jgi:hypothetical protein
VRLGGGAEANPGPVGQVGDPLGPQHHRESAQHAWQAPGWHDRYPVNDDLAPGDLEAVDDHDRHHHLRVGQDLGGSVSLERHGPQGGGKGVAAMTQPPETVDLEAPSILLGVDDEHPTGADHQVVEVGPAASDGQVVQDRPPVPLQPSQEAARASLPRRSAPPGDGIRASPSFRAVSAEVGMSWANGV